MSKHEEDNEFITDFRRRLIEWRKELKLSQAELSEHLGIGRTAVTQWEIGKSLPPFPAMFRLYALGFEVFPETINVSRTPLSRARQAEIRANNLKAQLVNGRERRLFDDAIELGKEMMVPE